MVLENKEMVMVPTEISLKPRGKYFDIVEESYPEDEIKRVMMLAMNKEIIKPDFGGDLVIESGELPF